MKRMIILVMVVFMMGLCGCQKSDVSVKYPLDQYDQQAYTLPYWSGNVMYQESVMVLANEDGSISDIPLLYHAEDIISVRSSILEKAYEEGKDYTLADGKLRILPDSAIQPVAYSDYYPKEPVETSFPRNSEYGDGYILFSEGSLLHSMQIAVTYTHSDSYTGKVPEYKGAQLPKTLSTLQNGEPLKIVLYGDSISTGSNSSGIVYAAPNAPAWHDMVLGVLKEKYPSANISFDNPSVGGMASAWGAENAKALVADKKPDLCIIGFGMNDGSGRVPGEVFKENIQQIIDTVSEANPSCEYILISTMLPNAEVASFLGNQKEYLPILESMEKTGIAVADMTSYHEYLLSKKRYYDMTGNNVNHPNDFLARAYAQVICQTLLGEVFG